MRTSKSSKYVCCFFFAGGSSRSDTKVHVAFEFGALARVPYREKWTARCNISQRLTKALENSGNLSRDGRHSPNTIKFSFRTWCEFMSGFPSFLISCFCFTVVFTSAEGVFLLFWLAVKCRGVVANWSCMRGLWLGCMRIGVQAWFLCACFLGNEKKIFFYVLSSFGLKWAN